MKHVVVLGAGGHAKVVIDILLAAGEVEIVGCIADGDGLTSPVPGIPVIGSMSQLESLRVEGLAAAIGVGGWTDTAGHQRIFEQANAAGVEIISAIHPAAVVAPSARLGAGCVLCAGAVINPEAILGENVIVATNSSIDHETAIADHCLISAGVTIGANANVGVGTLVAIGATITSRINVGAHCLVAAGSVVTNDIESNTTVLGIPARAR